MGLRCGNNDSRFPSTLLAADAVTLDFVLRHTRPRHPARVAAGSSIRP